MLPRPLILACLGALFAAPALAGSPTLDKIRSSGALRCGVLREELVEIMMQLVPYVGVAAAINGVTACRDVFSDEDRKNSKS